MPGDNLAWWSREILEVLVSDIAERWHWPPSEFKPLPITELVRWRKRMAVAMRRAADG